ncbi:AraC family transcriptional regulator [Actinoplanes derwentensis]|uniref:AraC-type DNA-binding protein n=1 Tax=Actinoplanes derwentensis TaxID=113562 RepID=A0A1H2D9W7_9ACTN|nr:helix-turn-helix domain-containing protein [Actinoplanes derwentensis]GID81594.1 AraC family transcriptional regulator [Actinoplanes derwentensis]SDT79389.1 AraC-type DNA-binding protein [Actinoplanes derwentensis]
MDEYAQARPGPALRPYVAFYSGYRQRDLAPAVHRGLPSPFLTLIFTLDEPLVITAHPDPRQAPGRFTALAGGLHLTPALIAHDGSQSGVQLAVRPLGCRALFGLPAAALAHLDVDAADVLGERFVARIREQLAAAPDWPARFAVLDREFGHRLKSGARPGPDAPPERVAHAFRLLAQGRPVGEVAHEVGWSGRRLTDRFRAEVGLRPKQAALVARFDRARRAIRPGVPLADVAAVHGYADQSHLVRDFQSFAGCAPSRWLADEFGLISALPVD